MHRGREIYDALECFAATGVAAVAIGPGDYFYFPRVPETYSSGRGARDVRATRVTRLFCGNSGGIRGVCRGFADSGVVYASRGAAAGIEMAVAIWRVHSGGGYLAIHNYEFPMALAVACFALATVGAGQASLDYAVFGKPKTGIRKIKA